jgi:hypothetical protein
MNIIIRRIRRWHFAKRCGGCGRKFMWKHGCPKNPMNHPQVKQAVKCASMAEEINAIHNQVVDNNALMSASIPYCCEECEDIDAGRV